MSFSHMPGSGLLHSIVFLNINMAINVMSENRVIQLFTFYIAVFNALVHKIEKNKKIH